jgi:hypothetical protein
MTAEKSLYPKVRRFLRHRGWRVESQVAPRPGSPRRFDVVGVKPRRRQVVVVEVKVRDFPKALRQAGYRQFVADLVYVGFPQPFARRVLRNHAPDLKATGLGLLGVGDRVHELFPPRLSTHVDPQRRDQLLEMVLEAGVLE